MIGDVIQERAFVIFQLHSAAWGADAIHSSGEIHTVADIAFDGVLIDS